MGGQPVSRRGHEKLLFFQQSTTAPSENVFRFFHDRVESAVSKRVRFSFHHSLVFVKNNRMGLNWREKSRDSSCEKIGVKAHRLSTSAESTTKIESRGPTVRGERWK